MFRRKNIKHSFISFRRAHLGFPPLWTFDLKTLADTWDLNHFPWIIYFGKCHRHLFKCFIISACTTLQGCFKAHLLDRSPEQLHLCQFGVKGDRSSSIANRHSNGLDSAHLWDPPLDGAAAGAAGHPSDVENDSLSRPIGQDVLPAGQICVR